MKVLLLACLPLLLVAASDGVLMPEDNSSTMEEQTSTPTGSGTGEACMTLSKQAGECVPYYLCEEPEVSISEVGRGLIDIGDGPCKHFLDLCCLPQHISPND